VVTNVSQHKRREAFLRMPLVDLLDWHLMATCMACRQERVVSIKSLIERYGGEITLARLVPRFRCGVATCRLPPAVLRLRNRMPAHPGPPLIETVLLDTRAGSWR
jgi:hypothetical protein